MRSPILPQVIIQHDPNPDGSVQVERLWYAGRSAEDLSVAIQNYVDGREPGLTPKQREAIQDYDAMKDGCWR